MTTSTARTFFVCFQAAPTALNPQHFAVSGAYAACWVLAEGPETAYSKARFFVTKGEWEVVGIETPPTEVVEAAFEGREIGLAQFRIAQSNGIAIAYCKSCYVISFSVSHNLKAENQHVGNQRGCE